LRVFVPSASGLLTLNNPFPLQSGFVPPPTLSSLSPDFVNGYLQHWNTALQRQIASVGSVSVAYARSAGSGLVPLRHLHQPPGGQEPAPEQPESRCRMGAVEL